MRSTSNAPRVYTRRTNATAAIPAVKGVFARRGIGADQVPQVSPRLPPLDQAAEATRAKRVSESFESVSPNLVKDTTDILFRDLWLRPDLAPREGDMGDYLARLLPRQAVILYAGWPSAFSALPVAKGVFDARAK